MAPTVWVVPLALPAPRQHWWLVVRYSDRPRARRKLRYQSQVSSVVETILVRWLHT